MLIIAAMKENTMTTIQRNKLPIFNIYHMIVIDYVLCFIKLHVDQLKFYRNTNLNNLVRIIYSKCSKYHVKQYKNVTIIIIF